MLHGRQRLLTLLRRSGARVVVLWGPPGVGKSRLAAELQPAATVRAPEDAPPKLARSRWVLLDDVAPSTAVLEKLARARTGPRWLVTTRMRPAGLPALDAPSTRSHALVALEVPPLALDEALALYAFACGAPERGAAPLVDRLVEAVDRLPGAVLRLGELDALLPRQEHEVDFDAHLELADGGSLDSAWGALPAAAREVAMAACVFPGRFDPADLGFALTPTLSPGGEGDRRRVLEGLRQLEAAGLLARDAPGVGLWFPARCAARRALRASGHEAAVLEQTLSHVASRPSVEPVPWLPIARARRSPALVPLLERAVYAALAAGRTAQARQWLDEALEPEDLVIDPEGRARLLVARSEVRSRLGEAADALGDAVEAFRLCDVVDRPALADAAKQALLSALVFTGRYRDARQLISQHQAVFASPLRRPDVVLRGVGLARYANGDVDRALGEFEVALPLAREAGDAQHELVVEGLIGLMRHERGELDEALARFDGVLHRARAEGDTYVEAAVRNWRAQVVLERGEGAQALAELDGARRALHEAGDTRFLRAVDGYRGLTLALLGRWAEAQDALEQCVTSARQAQDAYRLGNFLPWLAFVLRERGEVSRAAALFAEARELATAGHPNLEPVVLLLDDGLAHAAALRKAQARASSSVDVRLAWRLATSRSGRSPRVEVDPDGRFFALPDGRRVSLLKRRPLMRIVAALVRGGAGGLGLSTDEVRRAGWPGEAPKGRSGLQRVYVAISSLRKLGLEVKSGPEGYSL